MSPKQYKVWERDPFESPLHGESLADVEARLLPWFDNDLKPQLEDNKSVLVVSHSDTLKVLITLARGDGLEHSTDLSIEPGIPYFYYHKPR